jgi:hypothetical protein
MKQFIENHKLQLRIIGYVITLVWIVCTFVLDLSGVIPKNINPVILPLAGLGVFLGIVFEHIYSLEKQLLPRLDLVFGDFPACCDHWITNAHTNTLYRVGLVNLGGKTIEDVRVSLEKLEPQGITFGPIKLKFMHQRLYDEKYNLDPGTKPTVFVDVIQVIYITQETDRCNFRLQYALEDIPSYINPGNYRLSLVTEGKDVPPCRKSFLVSWDGENAKFTEERMITTLQ